MLFRLQTATIVGIEAIPVEVEVDVSQGLPGFHLVGLADGAVREGQVRIRSALQHCGFDVGCTRVTVNLAPAELRKDGAAFDLPIALGAMAARGLAKLQRVDLLFAGELALDGRLRPIRGALALAESAQRQGLAGIVLPAVNVEEAAHVEGLPIYGVENLAQAVAVAASADTAPMPASVAPPTRPNKASDVDFREVRGQPAARRAAEIAAAGGHNLMLIGPPGSGKTMIARRIATVMPPMTATEAIETTKIHSVAGLLTQGGLVRERPFRAPHHTCSSVGLTGGGQPVRPGEVSLAHNGVLFLDELPEFSRRSLECLRQPVEAGDVTVVRARQAVTFPARFMLVAAMNPCPCGFRGTEIRTCTCGERLAQRYVGRVSGPLLDRFDLFVRVEPVAAASVLADEQGEGSDGVAARVARARARQLDRFQSLPLHCNAQLTPRQIRRHLGLTAESRRLLETYGRAQQLSARVVHRTCRVARTIADLQGDELVGDEHVALALSLQQDRWLL